MKPKKMARIKLMAWQIAAKAPNTFDCYPKTKNGDVVIMGIAGKPEDVAAAYAVSVGFCAALCNRKLDDENFSPLRHVEIAATEMKVALDTHKAVDMCIEVLESIRADLQGFLAGFGDVAK